MQVIVAARHTEVTEGLRRQVERQFGRLERYEPRVSRAEVTLLEEKNRFEVEALVSVDGADPVHAHAEAGDFRTALDRVTDRVGRQLRRLRARRRDHQAPPAGSLPPRREDVG